MAAKQVTQKPMSLKIDLETLAKLENLCKAENRKKNEVINTAIAEYISNRITQL